MAVKKRGKNYYIRFKFQGVEIYRSAGTSNRAQALELEANVKKQLWDECYLDKKPEKFWIEAVTRYVSEATKKTLKGDVLIIKWLEPFLKNKTLSEIDRDLIEFLKREKMKDKVTAATINHYLRVIMTILRKCKKWGWITDIPTVERMALNNKRTRWLTVAQANELLAELPCHLSAMATFTLATGLRSRNVRLLKWSQIDFERRHAYVQAEDVKNNKALPVPLNNDALEVLQRQPRLNNYVFNYQGKPVGVCTTKAWHKALKRCGIEDFKWHDLRHTWASWHIQSGTSLQELQALGGWADFSMVLRYAHLSSEHLQEAADRISRAKSGQPELKLIKSR